MRELLQPREEIATFKKFQDGGGFAAVNVETVEAGKLFRLADFVGYSANLSQRMRVGSKVALDGEDANLQHRIVIGYGHDRTQLCHLLLFASLQSKREV